LRATSHTARLLQPGAPAAEAQAMSDRPSVLVVDASRLETCCEVLGLIGSDFVRSERMGAIPETLWPRDLLITSAAAARELTRLGLPALEPRPLWVCLHEEDVRAIGADLTAAGVDYLVPGPPDRELLRLLFLHALYQGVERRGELRLLCSHEVEYTARGARTRGQLMDLSRTGFRLLGPHPLASETPLELHVPSALDPGPPLAYPARVRRSAAALSGPDGRERTSIVARFAASSSPVHAARIAAVLEACAQTALPALGHTARGDRRFTARHRYAGVAAVRCLDADEYCIVQGAELSLSGMRLAFHPGLDIGAELSIGLHTGRGQPSVVLRGRVRHHDPSGLGVEFSELRPAESRVLQALIDDLPRLGAVSTGRGPGDAGPLLLCSVRL
jgi:hypothetical protein